MRSPLGIGLIPMTSTDVVEVNLKAALAQLKYFENKKTDLICFPENSLYFNFNKSLKKSDALELSHPAFKTLSQWAQKYNCFLHMGGIPLNENGTVFNASVLLSPEGEIKTVYRKIHLFDVDVQGKVVRESLSFDPGITPHTIDIRGWKIGLTICYDLRFSELFVHYHRQEVDLILVPAAFLVPTGRDHWATLLKARAIETQSFVAAAAQVGVHTSSQDNSLPARETWGESSLFDPWGVNMGTTKTFDGFKALGAGPDAPLWSELDPTLIQKTRAQIPLLLHRKLRF
jgi:deaminated glutathione amidase